MRLRGPHLIGQANLNTSDLSQAGTLGGFGIVLITTNGYAFIMDIVAEAIGQLIDIITMVSGPAPVADRDNARRIIVNPQAGSRAYAAEWRQINP